MRLDNQVCSLEYAKRLKELGIKQKSCFHWVLINNGLEIYRTVFEAKELNNTLACAFTVSELGLMLPFAIIAPCRYFDMKLTKHYLDAGCGYTDHEYSSSVSYNFYDDDISLIGFDFNEKTEADARARMLIHLIENKLIEVPA